MYVKKYLSSIQCWDLNPRPLDHESPTITTRPGLPPFIGYFHVSHDLRSWSIFKNVHRIGFLAESKPGQNGFLGTYLSMENESFIQMRSPSSFVSLRHFHSVFMFDTHSLVSLSLCSLYFSLSFFDFAASIYFPIHVQLLFSHSLFTLSESASVCFPIRVQALKFSFDGFFS